MYPKKCACCDKGLIKEKYDICSICGWEDDKIQNKDESFSGGANTKCLLEYRKEFLDKNSNWVAHYPVDVLEDTGLVKAFYTTTRNNAWKYGKDGSRENCDNLAQTLKISPEDMIMLNQTHTDGIRVVTRAEAGEMVTKPITIDGNDGMVTNIKGLLLATVEADCVPIYMLDPINKAIAMIHSGWRGTANQIGVNAVHKMEENYKTNPKDLIVVIGPCICKDCYEVGSDIIGDFEKHFGQNEIDQFFIPRNGEKYSLDLRKAIYISLLRAGVNINNIYDTGLCTYENDELCSWRRDKPIMRSMLTGIMLI